MKKPNTLTAETSGRYVSGSIIIGQVKTHTTLRYAPIKPTYPEVLTTTDE